MTRAIGGAGLVALIGLPFLMLSSALLDAPLAVPAAIATGHLATWHALASQRLRRAALINAAVLCGLSGWLVVFLLGAQTGASGATLSAALLAPLFAAAPALLRLLLFHGFVPRDSSPELRNAAADRVACLDELAPDEAVLIIGKDGGLLSATRAARRRLRLLPDGFEQNLMSIFEPADASRISHAIRRCVPGAAPVRATLTCAVGADNGREAIVSTMAAFDDASISMRIEKTSAPAATIEAEVGCSPGHRDRRALSVRARPVSDITEAAWFARRLCGKVAMAKHVVISADVEAGVHAFCDRQLGRRIVHGLCELAVRNSLEGGTVRVVVCARRAMVLIRVTFLHESEWHGDTPELATVRSLAEQARGTLIAEANGDGVEISVRLDRGDRADMERRPGKRAEAA